MYFYYIWCKMRKMSEVRREPMPENVRKIVLREQVKQKEKTGMNQFSIQSTIYKIILDWERCVNSGNEKNESKNNI